MWLLTGKTLYFFTVLLSGSGSEGIVSLCFAFCGLEKTGCMGGKFFAEWDRKGICFFKKADTRVHGLSENDGSSDE